MQRFKGTGKHKDLRVQGFGGSRVHPKGPSRQDLKVQRSQITPGHQRQGTHPTPVRKKMGRGTQRLIGRITLRNVSRRNSITRIPKKNCGCIRFFVGRCLGHE